MPGERFPPCGKVFLPPYSPDLNSIEKMWNRVRQLLRGIKARTQEALFYADDVLLGGVIKVNAPGWSA